MKEFKIIGKEIGIGAAHGVESWENSCGRGSWPKFNEEYTKILMERLKKCDVKTVADYGCGNMESYKGYIDWANTDFDFTGYDVHVKLVDELKIRYPLLKFDIVELQTLPPPADALIIKDVLIHWFDDDIETFFDTVFDSFRYVFYMHSTTKSGYPEKDRRTGSHRDYGPTDKWAEHLYGCKHVPIELIPTDNLIYQNNIQGDAPKTFMVFDRDV